jgi:hypothetical protein
MGQLGSLAEGCHSDAADPGVPLGRHCVDPANGNGAPPALLCTSSITGDSDRLPPQAVTLGLCISWKLMQSPSN